MFTQVCKYTFIKTIHNGLKVKSTQVSKPTVVLLYHGTQSAFKSNKTQIRATTNEFQRHYEKWNKSVLKDYILYDSFIFRSDQLLSRVRLFVTP